MPFRDLLRHGRTLRDTRELAGFQQEARQARAHGTENLLNPSSRFPHRLAQAPQLILSQDLIDPGSVMGDSGEDSRGLCILMYIGRDALGYPSTQEGPSRVSLLESKRMKNASTSTHPFHLGVAVRTSQSRSLHIFLSWGSHHTFTPCSLHSDGRCKLSLLTPVVSKCCD